MMKGGVLANTATLETKLIFRGNNLHEGENKQEMQWPLAGYFIDPEKSYARLIHNSWWNRRSVHRQILLYLNEVIFISVHALVA